MGFLVNCGVTRRSLGTETPVRLVFMNKPISDARDGSFGVGYQIQSHNYENLVISGVMEDRGNVCVNPEDYPKMIKLMVGLLPVLKSKDSDWRDSFKEKHANLSSFSGEQLNEDFNLLLDEVRSGGVFFLSTVQRTIVHMEVSYVDELVFEKGLKVPLELYSRFMSKSVWVSSFSEYLDYLLIEGKNFTQESKERLEEKGFYDGEDSQRRRELFTESRLFLDAAKNQDCWGDLGYYSLTYDYCELDDFLGQNSSLGETIVRYQKFRHDILTLTYLKKLGVIFQASEYVGEDYQDSYGKSIRFLLAQVHQAQKLANLEWNWECGDSGDEDKEQFVANGMSRSELDFNADEPTYSQVPENMEALKKMKLPLESTKNEN